MKLTITTVLKERLILNALLVQPELRQQTWICSLAHFCTFLIRDTVRKLSRLRLDSVHAPFYCLKLVETTILNVLALGNFVSPDCLGGEIQASVGPSDSQIGIPPVPVAFHTLRTQRPNWQICRQKDQLRQTTSRYDRQTARRQVRQSSWVFFL